MPPPPRERSHTPDEREYAAIRLAVRHIFVDELESEELAATAAGSAAAGRDVSSATACSVAARAGGGGLSPLTTSTPKSLTRRLELTRMSEFMMRDGTEAACGSYSPAIAAAIASDTCADRPSTPPDLTRLGMGSRPASPKMRAARLPAQALAAQNI